MPLSAPPLHRTRKPREHIPIILHRKGTPIVHCRNPRRPKMLAPLRPAPHERIDTRSESGERPFVGAHIERDMRRSPNLADAFVLTFAYPVKRGNGGAGVY